MRGFVVVILCSVVLGTWSDRPETTYLFYRELGSEFVNETKKVYFEKHESRRRGGVWVHSRRIFGGAAVQLGDFPATCALLDRYFAPRCSAAALSPHWALTAAHCVSKVISYIKYNTRLSASNEGDVVAVHYLYQHPEFKVLEEDAGKGLDVTMLHHDVGLVRTRDKMKLLGPLMYDPLAGIRRYDPMSLVNEEVQVLGFGRTDKTEKGEELCGARLRLVSCGRKEWYHVMCGTGGAGGGVCSGDSGGPVVFAGVQVAVTSMGPRECARLGPPVADAVSVFTSVRPYVDILNATMADADKVLRMRMLDAASLPRAHPFFNAIFVFLLRALLMQNHPG